MMRYISYIIDGVIIDLMAKIAHFNYVRNESIILKRDMMTSVSILSQIYFWINFVKIALMLFLKAPFLAQKYYNRRI